MNRVKRINRVTTEKVVSVFDEGCLDIGDVIHYQKGTSVYEDGGTKTIEYGEPTMGIIMHAEGGYITLAQHQTRRTTIHAEDVTTGNTRIIDHIKTTDILD